MPTPLKDLLAAQTIPAAPALARQENGDTIRCLACGHRCLIRDGGAGLCRVRFNQKGELRVPGGYVAGLQADPIEKKPFYHAFPGRSALSFGMLGCDLHCAYCQNWLSSQVLRDPAAAAPIRPCSAEQIVQMALCERAPVIVSTYNEPLITADWAAQIFALAREQNLICGFVSNGNASPEVLAFLRPFVDLYKVDLKTFDDGRYHTLGGKLATVLNTIDQLKSMDFWVEVVTLIVPGFNDSETELTSIAGFLAKLSPDIPWHVTAFHPDYHMEESRPTDTADLERAYSAGKAAGLRYVYAGNRPGGVGNRENTYCPGCGALLIRRHGFYVIDNRMNENACPDCGVSIAGVWEKDPPRHSEGSGVPRPILR